MTFKGGWLLLSWFFETVGKIQATDSNDSKRPAEYDARRILVRRCGRFQTLLRESVKFWNFEKLF